MLLPHQIDAAVRAALEEDAGAGDITTDLLLGGEEPRARGVFDAREEMVLAGLPVAERVFHILDPEAEFRPLARDGDLLAPGTDFAEVLGRASVLLIGERTALNFMAHLSGIATLVHRFREAMGASPARLLHTRKTTPGLRPLEVYAVTLGGGTIHRTDLHDGVLLKDNHADLAGGVGEAIRRVRERLSPTRSIEAEVRDLDELEEAIEAGAEVVLLDNFDTAGLEAAVQKAAGRVRLEASGGVRLENVAEIAATGVDAVSAGSITHSARSVDMSMTLSVTGTAD
jgi:nicotinate-nucleotide pyrophosphorylase (carboxylating)